MTMHGAKSKHDLNCFRRVHLQLLLAIGGRLSRQKQSRNLPQLDASAFIQHVAKGHLKKNRPSLWSDVPRDVFARALTRKRRASIRTLLVGVLLRGSCCDSNFPGASVAWSFTYVLQEPPLLDLLAACVSVLALIANAELEEGGARVALI